ncbi:MAG: rod-binding protein [Massilia sp.]|nr:rod-binding protein [Massilia sp.]
MLGSTSDLSSKFALDTNSLGDLKQSAKSGSPEALKGAATQFESMFVNMMMKSMRDATPQDGMTDSQDTKTFTGMLDQQMSQKLAKRGIGLADALVRQLTVQQQGQQLMQDMNKQALGIGGATQTGTGTGAAVLRMQSDPDTLPTDGTAAPGAAGAAGITGSARGTEHANKPAHVRAFRNADGSSSNNLFGIKAGPGWKGKVATAVTTEYVHGKPHTRVEKFRAYDSHADAFKDYARMLSNNPRYEKVLAHGGDAATFAHGLQRAGYATDPQYKVLADRAVNDIAKEHHHVPPQHRQDRSVRGPGRPGDHR